MPRPMNGGGMGDSSPRRDRAPPRGTSMPTVVEVRDLHKTFRPQVFGRPVHALRGVGFEVRDGACFGYLGQNGAGKTTTLKVLTGLMTPSRGSAKLLSRSCGDEQARRDLGYLPEN